MEDIYCASSCCTRFFIHVVVVIVVVDVFVVDAEVDVVYGVCEPLCYCCRSLPITGNAQRSSYHLLIPFISHS